MSAIPIYFCKESISVHPGCVGGGGGAGRLHPAQPCQGRERERDVNRELKIYLLLRHETNDVDSMKSSEFWTRTLAVLS